MDAKQEKSSSHGLPEIQKTPKISALMPVYNTDVRFLRAAIESVLWQTFRDFELIIVNDGSTDEGIKRTVMSFDDERIKYFSNEKNLGISATRNRLINLAMGEYLAVVDHDDVSLPERFEREASYLDEHGDVGVVSSWIRIHNSDRIMRDKTEDREIKESLLTKFCMVHPAAMIRKSVLVGNNIKYESEFFPSEDYALWCRLISKTKFHVIPEILFEYRKHRKCTSLRFSKQLRHMGYVIQEFARRENPDLWNGVKAKMTRHVYVKLFRYIPLLKIVRKGNRTSLFLFNFIPLLYWRTRCDI
jgi:glycosyltransferase involved in cell wall biosynthesis